MLSNRKRPLKRHAGSQQADVGDDELSPKTTRPEAAERRLPEPARTAEKVIGRKLDAQPDRIDIRDWVYEPSLSPLPDWIDNRPHAPEILDQGEDGACTGFALAAVLNFLLRMRRRTDRVSPWMLYHMARRYDEWPGEGYEGSSARGAMIGLVRHGVCARKSWSEPGGLEQFTQELAQESLRVPGGAYFRVSHRQVRDVHASLAEVGAVYMTLMVHEGWASPVAVKTSRSAARKGQVHPPLRTIVRKGRATDGHAVAIVGYTRDGFIIQNSWGSGWGSGGFALLPYEDYMLHATDVWVVQLGVPVNTDLWSDIEVTHTVDTAGRFRATSAIPLAEIRPYVIDEGNNGKLSNTGQYWTTTADLDRIFGEEIPKAAADWKDKRTKRILLYLHGGLNSEEDVARRVVAFRDVFLANEIYPLHIMWESGFMEALRDLVDDVLHKPDERAAGPADWLRRFRDGLVEAKDLTLEYTVAAPGSLLWSEMKQNARLASNHLDGDGTMQLLTKHAAKALSDLGAHQGWEIHVVAHSAGSIYIAYAMPLLLKLGVPVRTLQFLAPAIRVDLFRKALLRLVRVGKCPHPTLYILSESGERDDDVGPYGKSLLYLVSNSFEGERGVPILGMERFIHRDDQNPSADVDIKMDAFFRKRVDGLPSLVIAGAPHDNDEASWSQSQTHGGFDNDVATMNSVLRRILNQPTGDLTRKFDLRDLQF